MRERVRERVRERRAGTKRGPCAHGLQRIKEPSGASRAPMARGRAARARRHAPPSAACVSVFRRRSRRARHEPPPRPSSQWPTAVRPLSLRISTGSRWGACRPQWAAARALGLTFTHCSPNLGEHLFLELFTWVNTCFERCSPNNGLTPFWAVPTPISSTFDPRLCSKCFESALYFTF